MKHALVTDLSLNGYEYGVLRAFEDAIVEYTGAMVIALPGELGIVKKKMGHSMRLGPYRRYLPVKTLHIEADVIWCILMGPENFRLDLFKDWMKLAKYRIVYLFDTLDHQFELIKKLFSDDSFNIRITSFNDAVPFLKKLTNKKWYSIEQAVPDHLFSSLPFEERLISFSSYGRRLERFHEVLIDFCKKKNLYLDFTTHDGKHPSVGARDLYHQYAWHLQHSLFTISWPVEITNPTRAGRLHPITCRWFEAASAGTVIIGKSPENPGFKKALLPNLVTEIDPFASKEDIFRSLEEIWETRRALAEQAHKRSLRHSRDWTWKSRITEIMEIVKTN